MVHLTITMLFDGRHYRETSESPTFPGIPVRQWIPEYVQRAWQAGSSVALREFESVLRRHATSRE
jgi:hypothetical protein